jgi:hypothetical protein
MGHEREGRRAGDRTRAARYDEEVLKVGVKVRTEGIARSRKASVMASGRRCGKLRTVGACLKCETSLEKRSASRGNLRSEGSRFRVEEGLRRGILAV